MNYGQWNHWQKRRRRKIYSGILVALVSFVPLVVMASNGESADDKSAKVSTVARQESDSITAALAANDPQTDGETVILLEEIKVEAEALDSDAADITVAKTLSHNESEDAKNTDKQESDDLESENKDTEKPTEDDKPGLFARMFTKDRQAANVLDATGGPEADTNFVAVADEVNLGETDEITEIQQIESGSINESNASNEPDEPIEVPEEGGVDIVTPTDKTIRNHTVQSGETISEIAEKYGISTATIRWANDLEYNSIIKIGQELLILPISGTRHKVKNGETLGKIALDYDADAQEILLFNELPPDAKIFPGDELIIPGGVESDESKGSAGTKNTSSSNNTIVNKTKSSSTSSATKCTEAGYFLKPVADTAIKTRGYTAGFKHKGVDYADKHASAIFASASGTVIAAKGNGAWNGGYGNYIVISHSNGMQTLYAHLSSLSVTKGDIVSKGAVIGGMGNTGRSTGTHLHFEIRDTGGSATTCNTFAQ